MGLSQELDEALERMLARGEQSAELTVVPRPARPRACTCCQLDRFAQSLSFSGPIPRERRRRLCRWVAGRERDPGDHLCPSVALDQNHTPCRSQLGPQAASREAVDAVESLLQVHARAAVSTRWHLATGDGQQLPIDRHDRLQLPLQPEAGQSLEAAFGSARRAAADLAGPAASSKLLAAEG